MLWLSAIIRGPALGQAPAACSSLLACLNESADNVFWPSHCQPCVALKLSFIHSWGFPEFFKNRKCRVASKTYIVQVGTA